MSLYLYRMNEENEGKEFTGVSEEQIKQWDAEDGYTYQGLYTNDVLDRLVNEMVDETFISQFFGTNKKEELVTLPIKYHTAREDKVDISVLMDQTEKRLNEKDIEERE